MPLGKIHPVGSHPQRPTSSGSGSGSDSPDSPRTTRGSTSAAANEGILGKHDTTITGSTKETSTSPAAYGLPAPAYSYVSQVPTSSSVDKEQIKKNVTKAAVDVLNPLLESLQVKDVLVIRFDTDVTLLNTCRMYVELPEDGVIIRVFREILNNKKATHLDYEVDFNQPNPEQQVLEEILCDLLVLSTLDKLISIKKEEVSRNPWGKYDGGAISIGPRNKASNGNFHRTSKEEPENIVFRWKSPEDFIYKYQNGEMARTFSEVKGLDHLSELLPKIPPQFLSLLDKEYNLRIPSPKNSLKLSDGF